MDWSKGYSAAYYMQRVDPATWRDIGLIQVTGGSIKRMSTGKRESADVDCVGIDIGVEQWVRIYLDASQDGSTAHVALFTGLATSPAKNIDGVVTKSTLTCYSVLKPCEDVDLPLGWYAPAGASGGEVIRSLLTASPAPVVIADSSPTLTSAIVAEGNENHLTMIDKILSAMGWRIRIDGDGTVNVEPKPVDAAVVFDPLSNDVIETKIKLSADWYSCPNVYRATSGDVTGIARDEDPDSALSTVGRGREVWKSESGVNLASTESIAQYAARKLKEAQQVKQTASYDRRYYPGLVPGDRVQMHYPEQGLSGVFTIESQTTKLGHGGTTSEQVTSI